MKNTFDLLPCDSHKSFYGKAVVITENNSKFLRSYNTIVCHIDENNNFVKDWNDYSATTMRHINSFREYYGFPKMSKKEWENMK